MCEDTKFEKGSIVKVASSNCARMGVLCNAFTKEQTKLLGWCGQIIDCIMFDTGNRERFACGWEVISEPSDADIQQGMSLLRKEYGLKTTAMAGGW